MRRLVWLLGFLLVACVSHGPRSFTLSPAEIERQVQVDLGAVNVLFKDTVAPKPRVTMMPGSDRVGLAWDVSLPAGVMGGRSAVVLELSGKPVLNAARSGVNLSQVRVEDIRMPGLSGVLALSRLFDLKGSEQTFPDLPLAQLPENMLVQQAVAYGATAVSVGYDGLKIELAPK